MLRDRARERVRERIDEAAAASSPPVKSGARSGTTTRADPKFDGKTHFILCRSFANHIYVVWCVNTEGDEVVLIIVLLYE